MISFESKVFLISYVEKNLVVLCGIVLLTSSPILTLNLNKPWSDNWSSQVINLVFVTGMLVQTLSKWLPFLWVACCLLMTGLKRNSFPRNSHFSIPIRVRVVGNNNQGILLDLFNPKKIELELTQRNFSHFRVVWWNTHRKEVYKRAIYSVSCPKQILV